MTRNDYLLIQLASEANEVAHIISKALQFGLNEQGVDEVATNKERTMEEVADFLGVLEMCLNEGLVERWSDERLNLAIEAKRIRVEKFMVYSKQIGITKN